ncbi:MAG: adenylate/guanylate cyclase domain-containing protein [Alphaproteobacteria bacterium]|nr:adenylate/guanylate cyclase domain-containing protein [Alphaproteobacteria bacterium]
MAEAATAWVDRARLWSGLTLFVYVTSHFVNHMIGIISIGALEAGREIFMAVWQSRPGTIALYGALAVHLLIAARAFLLRERLKSMTRQEVAQLALGAVLPFLLIEHVTATRLAQEFFALEPHYRFVLLAHWVFVPYTGFVQAAAVLAAWVHGCIGIDFWLSSKPGYRRWRPYLFTPAVIVPTVAMIGWVDAGLFVQQMAQDRAWLSEALTSSKATLPGMAEKISDARDRIWAAYALLLVFLVLARITLHSLDRRAGRIRITYPQGQKVQIAKGTTVLEASRIGGIPHASVCGGRGRCSTCRIRVDRGADTLPAASEAERKVLRRVSAPPRVRLACQLRPETDLQITPLIPPSVRGAPGIQRTSTAGEEREIAVLFADIRSFTKLAEAKLPYDTVYLLNRYFAEMGAAVSQAGGKLDKFIGDGVMALFGIEEGPATGSRQAIDAARRMAENLERLNASLADDLPEPIRIGIGVHAGPCIVGEMGYGDATGMTAIGDTVNIASRLESLTKDYQVQLIVSETAGNWAGIDLGGFATHETEVRGRVEPLGIVAIPDGKTVPATGPSVAHS